MADPTNDHASDGEKVIYEMSDLSADEAATFSNLLTGLGLAQVAAYERELLAYGTEVLQQISGVRLIGTASEKASILSFVMEGVHPHDIGTVVDQSGVAIRTGHHCTQPVMDRFGIPATARASLAMYNTREDIDALGAALERVREVFA